jgi:hypothetical protein
MGGGGGDGGKNEEMTQTLYAYMNKIKILKKIIIIFVIVISVLSN